MRHWHTYLTTRFGVFFQGSALLALVAAGVVYPATLAYHTLREAQTVGFAPQQPATITVEGTGRVHAVPDVALLTATVRRKAATPAEAQRALNEALNRIMQALRTQYGFTDTELRTRSYQVVPRYEWRIDPVVCIQGPCPTSPERRTRVQVGYEGHVVVEVRSRDVDRVVRAAGALTAVGATEVGEVQFVIDDPDALRRAARRRAIAQAREEAKALAAALGVRVVRLVAYEDGRSPVGPLLRASVAEAGDGDKALPPTPPDLAPGQQEFVHTVRLRYEVR